MLQSWSERKLNPHFPFDDTFQFLKIHDTIQSLFIQMPNGMTWAQDLDLCLLINTVVSDIIAG